MALIQVRLLGDFQLRYQDRQLCAVHQPRVQSLLAYLLLNRHTPQSRQQLAFLFWPDTSEEQARTNLRNLLFQLRTILPAADDFFQIDRSTVYWQPETDFTLDVAEFEDAVRTVESVAGDTGQLQNALERAVALYTGDLLPQLYDEWIVVVRERLHLQYEQLLARLVTLQEAQGDYCAAIANAQRLLCDDPMREESYRTLMRLHALNDDRAAALRVYHTCSKTLQRELDVPPSPATQALVQHLLTGASGEQAGAATLTPPVPAMRLIGRCNAWQQVLNAWRHVHNARCSHVVLITGDAGIGKTRLAEELVDWSARQGIATAVARCYPAEGRPAYAPLVSWLHTPPLQQAFVQLAPVWQAELVRLAPGLPIVHPKLPKATQPLYDCQQPRLFAALAQLIYATRQPLLLVLDDLQWADAATLEWLHYLLRAEPQPRLLLVCTLDSSAIEGNHPLHAWGADLTQQRQLMEVELGPLDEQAAAELAAALVGRPLDATEVAHLYQESEGHPLFIHELLQAGRLAANPDRVGQQREFATGNDRAEQALPPRIQALLEVRLHTLAPATQEVIAIAAVIGREFTFDLLTTVSDMADATVIHALDEAWRRRIIREENVNHYRFSHDKLRQVAWAHLSQTHRHWLQGRVTKALASRPTSIE